ncbi:FadR/GntR family transcriptional regulator [Bacillus salipaludis]|uniref:FadR/GntR family transcriptional regulator n=1 Tax=Bacillus salipaludis TaxID=2547811 RepID=UPI002E1A6C7C|nr:FadR/GntR family transcriptional regulator [Bacillus salipaludis]
MAIISETVQKFLCDLIQNKNLKPGDPLPSERELAKWLEVSRTSVREALQTLSEKGIITKQIGKGAFVKKNPFVEDREISKSLMMSMDVNNSLELLEFRKAIEVEIAYLAAKRIQSYDIQILENSLIDLEVCIKMESSIIVPDLVFHGTLARSINNEVMIQTYNSISDFFKRVRIEMAVYDDVQNALYYHQQILNAIKNGEAERSSKLMREHIEDVQQHYQNMLKQLQNS